MLPHSGPQVPGAQPAHGTPCASQAGPQCPAAQRHSAEAVHVPCPEHTRPLRAPRGHRSVQRRPVRPGAQRSQAGPVQCPVASEESQRHRALVARHCPWALQTVLLLRPEESRGGLKHFVSLSAPPHPSTPLYNHLPPSGHASAQTRGRGVCEFSCTPPPPSPAFHKAWDPLHLWGVGACFPTPPLFWALGSGPTKVAPHAHSNHHTLSAQCPWGMRCTYHFKAPTP